MGRPAVFLDRDGTVVREVEYLRSVKELRLLPGAAAAIRKLNDAGFAVVVTTNQSGIARGLLSEDDLSGIHAGLCRRLARRGARLDGIYYCPHHPEAARSEYRRRCWCRKPSPGMLLRAAEELGLDVAQSFAVGDSQRDIEAGRQAGCRTVLVRTGYGKEMAGRLDAGVSADHVADDLSGAVAWVVRQAEALGRGHRGRGGRCRQR